MAGFTSEEVQNKINQFLRTQIKVGRTRIGSRDILTLRDEAYDLLTTSILLRSDSFFYIVSRATNRLEALRRKQAVDVADILAALPGTAKRGVPIESTAELVNAQAALLEINAGLNARTGSGIRGSIGPGVERFNRATERFLSTELVPNIVEAGTIVETADELRATIARLLTDVAKRHADMVVLVDNILSAVTELDSVRLPEQAVQGIVSRISNRLDEVVEEMGGDGALALAREDALDLFVMRVLLARSSSFRTPLLVLAPLTGDATTMTLTGGVVPGEVLGTVSGPYNYGASTILAITTDSGGGVNFASPGDSRATIETLALPVSVDFGVGTAEIALSVEGGGIVTDTWTGVNTIVAVAADIDTLLGVSGSASVVSSKIVIQSANEDDESSLELFLDTDDRKLFAATVSPQKIFAGSVPPSAEEIAAAVRTDVTVNADVDPEVITTDHGTFAGVISAVGGEEDLLTVDGEDFTAISAGTRIQVTSGDGKNRGFYRVLSGTVGSLTVTRDFVTRPDTVTFNLFSEFLKLKATDTTPTDGIYIDTAGDVQAAIGLTVDAALNKGLANTGVIGTGDLLERGVQVEDLLLLDTDTPETARSLLSVGRQTVTFSPGFTYGVGATTVVSFSVRSLRYQSYRFLIDGTTSLEKGAQAWIDQWRDFTELDRVVGQVIRGGHTSQAEALLQSYLDSETSPADPAKVADLTTLGADLLAFVIPFEPTIDNILRLLSEQGMDRALELLVTLELITFFTMSAEGVSYSTWLTRQAADTARNIAPVSKYGRGDKVGAEVEVLASQPDPFDPDAGDFSSFLGSDDF